MVAGYRHLVDPPMSPFVSSFLFLWACVCCCPAGVVMCLYRWLYVGRCFIYKAGRKPISRGMARMMVISKPTILQTLYLNILSVGDNIPVDVEITVVTSSILKI